MQIYISGALQASRDLRTARLRYEHAAAVVAAAGHDAYLPHQFTDPETAAGIAAADVFARDRAALHRSDAIVAFLDEPSLGVGCELALAHQQRAFILGLHHETAKVSRFAIGYLDSVGAVLRTYRTSEEIAVAIRDFIRMRSTSDSAGWGRIESGPLRERCAPPPIP